MNYDPEKLESITFGRSFLHGYNKNQVDEVMTKVIQDYRKSACELNQMKEQLSTLDDTVKHYKSLEEAMQHCFLVAQKTSDEMKAAASDKAQGILEEAEKTSQRMVSDANQQVNKINMAYEELKAKMFTFQKKAEALLNAQLEVINQLSDE
ncbi:MAG: DivIVA domain-containing protein [Clostridiales bacterium]|jgi:cell division initiation protein|nr:DivIVA domain-containing protein [Clostridiales bacterium]